MVERALAGRVKRAMRVMVGGELSIVRNWLEDAEQSEKMVRAMPEFVANLVEDAEFRSQPNPPRMIWLPYDTGEEPDEVRDDGTVIYYPAKRDSQPEE